MLSRGPSSRPSRCVTVRTMPWVSTRDRRAMAPLRVCRSGRVGEKQLLDLGKLVKQRPSLALRLAPYALRLAPCACASIPQPRAVRGRTAWRQPEWPRGARSHRSRPPGAGEPRHLTRKDRASGGPSANPRGSCSPAALGRSAAPASSPASAARAPARGPADHHPSRPPGIEHAVPEPVRCSHVLDLVQDGVLPPQIGTVSLDGTKVKANSSLVQRDAETTAPTTGDARR